MVRFWWVFVLFAKTASANDNKLPGVDPDKGARYLSAYDTKPYRPGGLPPLTTVPISGDRCSSRLENALDQMKRRKRTQPKNLDTPLYWNDYKSKLKKMSAALRVSQQQTGGGPSQVREMNDIEKKFLNLLGEDFGQGVPGARVEPFEESQSIDLNGYRLYQTMRSAPVDMYVTRMRVRLPQNSDWVRVEKCYFDPRNVSLDTMLLFNDITISGNVDLYDAGELDRSNWGNRRSGRDYDPGYDPYLHDPYRRPRNNGCNMILRLRKAGIGFHTTPLNHQPGKFNVKTDSEFVEPGFISVYAYGCEKYINRNSVRNKDNLPLTRRKRSDEFAFEPRVIEPSEISEKRSADNWDIVYEASNNRNSYERSKSFKAEDDLDDVEDISREMENIFTKGIRTLLTTYMKKELQPAIKDTLMRNMGYVISYG